MRMRSCACANGTKIACSRDAQCSIKLSRTKLDVLGKVQLGKTNITRDIAIQP